MLKYILRRLIGMIPVMLVMSIILFGMMQLMPGNPLDAYVGLNSKMTPERKAQLAANLGLDKSIPEQYVRWLKETVSGNFGESYKLKKPVVDIMGPAIWNSFLINISSMLIAFAISIPVGIKSAVKKHGLYDNTWTLISLVGISFPTFFMGLLLIYVFSIQLGWTPLSGMVSAAIQYNSVWDKVKDIAWHIILPTIVLVITQIAQLTKYVRNAMLEVIQQDYIRTARAKGLNEKVVIYKHAFRNALIPIVTQIGLMIPALFSGAVILEKVFNWPGIGKIMYDGVMGQDIPLVLTSNMFFALLMLIGNLLSDIGYALVDPRVKVE